MRWLVVTLKSRTGTLIRPKLIEPCQAGRRVRVAWPGARLALLLAGVLAGAFFADDFFSGCLLLLCLGRSHHVFLSRITSRADLSSRNPMYTGCLRCLGFGQLAVFDFGDQLRADEMRSRARNIGVKGIRGAPAARAADQAHRGPRRRNRCRHSRRIERASVVVAEQQRHRRPLRRPAPSVQPPTTNSCRGLGLTLVQSCPRLPGRYLPSRRFATTPSIPRSIMREQLGTVVVHTGTVGVISGNAELLESRASFLQDDPVIRSPRSSSRSKIAKLTGCSSASAATRRASRGASAAGEIRNRPPSSPNATTSPSSSTGSDLAGIARARSLSSG